MPSDRKSSLLPDYVHELAERGKARKIIHGLNKPALSDNELERLKTEIDDLLDDILNVLADATNSSQDKAIALLNEAKKALGEPTTDQDVVTATRKIAQADQIARRWQSEKRQATSIFWVGLAITLSAIVLLILYVIVQDFSFGEPFIPLLGVPPSVIVWGGLGGVAAVIRSLMKPEQISPPFRHVRILLVTRPIYGMIAGCVVYLLIISGLTAFAYTTQAVAGENNSNQPLLAAMAFAGGFYAPFLDKLLFSVSSTEDSK